MLARLSGSRQMAAGRGQLMAAAGSGHECARPAAPAREPAPLSRRAGACRVRIVIRLLSCVVIASAAVTVWTRAALVFVLGSRLAAVCLWIAAGGSVCAVITLALTRKPSRPQPFRPPEPPPAGAVRRDHVRVGAAAMSGQQTRRAHRPP
jgi:hypothetical protein